MRLLLARFGRFLRAWWMKFAELVAYVNTRVLLTVVYVVVIGPVWLVTRLLGKDFLDRGLTSDGTYWREREAGGHEMKDVRRQF